MAETYKPLDLGDNVFVLNSSPKTPRFILLEREEHTSNKIAQRKRSSFSLLLRLLSVTALMYLAYAGLRNTRYGARMCHRLGLAQSRNISTSSKLPTHYTLPSGDKIPSVALGVWQAKSNEVGAAVEAALKAGYRHIDGAWIYGNEAEVGKAIRSSGVPRSDIWLTSKLWNTFHAPEAVEPALDESLQRLGTDYLDLYLVHWPIAFAKSNPIEIDEVLTANPYPTWQKLEEMVEKGKVRNIGISNFNIPRIKNLTSNALKIQPAINQVELNYFNPQPELLQWSKENNILLEAYSPLGSNKQVGETLKLEVVKDIAKQLSITPAQVIISWQIQRGAVVLPKSVHPERVIENLQVYALPDDLFNKLEKAATSHPPQRVSNPSKGWGVGFDIFDDYPYDN